MAVRAITRTSSSPTSLRSESTTVLSLPSVNRIVCWPAACTKADGVGLSCATCLDGFRFVDEPPNANALTVTPQA